MTVINFKQYEQVTDELRERTNSLWNRVTFVNIADILSGDVDLMELDQAMRKLLDAEHLISKKLEDEVGNLSEEDYDAVSSEYYRVSDLIRVVYKKINLVESVIYSLRKIEEDLQDNNATHVFSDIRSMNLGESIISIGRIIDGEVWR